MGKLTVLKAKALTTPGRYGDGGGLWLQVRQNGRSWLFRYMRQGRAREMGLGSFDLVTLAEAREEALAARKLLRTGVDPIDQKREKATEAQAAKPGTTFRAVTDLFLAAHEAGWRNEKHRWQWRHTLETHAYPQFGDRPVSSVETADVMRVLEPIWREKPETASRIRGRIEAVLDYANARGWRQGDNPARWRGHLANLLPARSRITRVEHHAALAYVAVPAFMATLRGEGGLAARALEFTILTAARTGETLGARWSEIDLSARIWTVPAERMKAGLEHRVPLSEPALAVLETVRPLAGDYVFPGKAGKPLSNMAMVMLLRRMGHGDLTVHGFRSTFRDWTAETTDYPREVAEAALAHTLRDKVEAAYRRGDLFAKRVRLMEEWGVFFQIR